MLGARTELSAVSIRIEFIHLSFMSEVNGNSVATKVDTNKILVFSFSKDLYQFCYAKAVFLTKQNSEAI